MLNVYPDADLYAIVDFLPQGIRGFIKDKTVVTTFIQTLPKSKSNFRSWFSYIIKFL